MAPWTEFNTSCARRLVGQNRFMSTQCVTWTQSLWCYKEYSIIRHASRKSRSFIDSSSSIWFLLYLLEGIGYVGSFRSCSPPHYMTVPRSRTVVFLRISEIPFYIVNRLQLRFSNFHAAFVCHRRFLCRRLPVFLFIKWPVPNVIIRLLDNIPDFPSRSLLAKAVLLLQIIFVLVIRRSRLFPPTCVF